MRLLLKIHQVAAQRNEVQNIKSLLLLSLVKIILVLYSKTSLKDRFTMVPTFNGPFREVVGLWS